MDELMEEIGDMREETDEVKEILRKDLKEILGVEIEFTRISQNEGVTINIKPTGLEEKLEEKYENADVDVRGQFSVSFVKTPTVTTQEVTNVGSD